MAISISKVQSDPVFSHSLTSIRFELVHRISTPGLVLEVQAEDDSSSHGLAGGLIDRSSLYLAADDLTLLLWHLTAGRRLVFIFIRPQRPGRGLCWQQDNDFHLPAGKSGSLHGATLTHVFCIILGDFVCGGFAMSVCLKYLRDSIDIVKNLFFLR